MYLKLHTIVIKFIYTNSLQVKSSDFHMALNLGETFRLNNKQNQKSTSPKSQFAGIFPS